VIVYAYSGSLEVTSSLANVRCSDDSRVFPIALLVIFGGGSQALTEIYPKNVERGRSPASVHAENHYGLARYRLRRNR